MKRHPASRCAKEGAACLAAEQTLAAHRLGQRSIILRMAGLYGPERIPNAATIRRNEPIGVAAHAYLNLIHIDDAANIVVEADQQVRPPRMFLVSDGHPVLRRAYYEELARLLGAGAPRFVAPAADSPAGSRAESSKRINNARLMAELDVRLVYPSFREGLAAIVAAENAGDA